MFEWFKKLAAKKPQQEVQPVRYPEQHKVLPSIPKRHVGFIITSDVISLVLDGKPYSIGKSHLNYSAILGALKADDYDALYKLVDVSTAIKNQTKGKVVVNEYGEVFHNGQPVHNVIGTRISEFVREGLPFEPLARFLENLMLNPNERSIEQLYSFLEHGGFPITPDGCFLAYKGVTEDFKDIHTKSFDNAIGAKNTMPRSQVDHDSGVACSTGFHVGTHGYATEFARVGKVVMVKVNPKDAVSVPEDHNCEKLRVCEYEVVAMCPGKVIEPLSNIGYQGDNLTNEDEDFGDDFYDDDSLHDLEDEFVDEVEASTGRKRGPGGKFLPKNG